MFPEWQQWQRTGYSRIYASIGYLGLTGLLLFASGMIIGMPLEVLLGSHLAWAFTAYTISGFYLGLKPVTFGSARQEKLFMAAYISGFVLLVMWILFPAFITILWSVRGFPA